jgi:hypothetical protein
MRDRRIRRDLLLQHVLNRAVGDRMLQGRCRDRDRAGPSTVADRASWHAVFGQLINQMAGQDEIEKLIDRGRHAALRRLVPPWPPENREHLHRGQQRAISIGQLRGGGRCSRRVSRGLARGIGDGQRHNSDRIAMGGMNVLAGMRSTGHDVLHVARKGSETPPPASLE